MITLTLLHPVQSTPVQSWTFEQESVIRIGRATDNHVILYSAVVSRHHVELRRCTATTWEIVSLGANGTYLDGQQITQVPVSNGTVIRLARSGPNLQINFEVAAVVEREDAKLLNRFAALQDDRPAQADALTQDELQKAVSLEEPSLEAPHTAARFAAPRTRLDMGPAKVSSQAESIRKQVARHETLFDVKIPRDQAGPPDAMRPCTHGRVLPGMLFCPDCGQPMQVLRRVGDYQILRTLGAEGIALTQLAWRQGQSVLIHSLEPSWSRNAEAIALFTQRAQTLALLRHPHLPRSVEFLIADQQPFWITESWRGQTLKAQIARHGAMSAPQSIALTLQLCNVLDYLHQQAPPLIHQVLKPEHLLLQTLVPGVVTVTLGGFLALPGPHQKTNFADNLYAAPEQKLGRAVSAATDLFTLGLILLYLLTGQEPRAFYQMNGSGGAIALPPLPGVDPALVNLLQKLTQSVPSQRYTQAHEVAEVLLSLG